METRHDPYLERESCREALKQGMSLKLIPLSRNGHSTWHVHSPSGTRDSCGAVVQHEILIAHGADEMEVHAVQDGSTHSANVKVMMLVNLSPLDLCKLVLNLTNLSVSLDWLWSQLPLLGVERQDQTRPLNTMLDCSPTNKKCGLDHCETGWFYPTDGVLL
jgi:hypothetical protein